MILAAPAKYFPIDKKIYEVGPGLKPLGHDFGNGELDQKVFQIDSKFNEYRLNKIACRAERLSKYVAHNEFSTSHAKGMANFVIERLLSEYPDLIIRSTHHNITTLNLRHTGDTISYTDDFTLVKFESPDSFLAPTDLLDALALQVAEDYALQCRRPDRSDYLGYLHLSSPSHWAAEDKIGKTFAAVHCPIPHIEKMTRVADNMVDAMVNKGPFVRFVWSFVTDTRLNHHPTAPLGFDQVTWKGRSFNSDLEIPFYLRIERQVVYGIPQIDAAYFGIGITFIDGVSIKNDSHMREQLTGALESMSPHSRIYKGVDQCFNQLVSWLNT